MTVIVAEDDGDSGPWIDVVDATEWLRPAGSDFCAPADPAPKLAQRQWKMDLDEEDEDEETFVYPGAEPYGDEEEEDVQPPKYKKGKFGIFCSAAYNQSKARGYH